jgi:raffinose/stachyose/melibiose transport system permease protein
MGSRIKKNIVETIAILMTLIILIPIYMLVINSFKDRTSAADLNLSWPLKWSILENYSELIKAGNIITAFKNSVIISVITVFFLVMLSAMAGFIIQRRKTKLTEFTFIILLMGLIIPPSIVPTYFIAKYLHMTGGYLGLCAVLFTLNFSVSVFLYAGYFKSIPSELDESAIIDGSGPYRLFFNIIFPILKPVTVTVIIIDFLSVWNDFGTSIYFLSRPEKYTMIMSTFYFFGARSADWNLVFACVVLTSLPVIILYVFLQKYIISGIVSGGVKG